MATDADPTQPDDADEILRAKYVEYCSAQLADLLLYLSPDEIYLLAEKAAREGGAPTPLERSYSTLVQQATRHLANRVSLPPFEVWLEDYRQHRDRYEAYFMGLWESDLAGDPPRNGGWDG